MKSRKNNRLMVLLLTYLLGISVVAYHGSQSIPIINFRPIPSSPWKSPCKKDLLRAITRRIPSGLDKKVPVESQTEDHETAARLSEQQFRREDEEGGTYIELPKSILPPRLKRRLPATQAKPDLIQKTVSTAARLCAALGAYFRHTTKPLTTAPASPASTAAQTPSPKPLDLYAESTPQATPLPAVRQRKKEQHIAYPMPSLSRQGQISQHPHND